MEKATLGAVIEFKKENKHEKGKVIGIRENSVIVEFGQNKKTGEPLKTVINHKNYKLI